MVKPSGGPSTTAGADATTGGDCNEQAIRTLIKLGIAKRRDMGECDYLVISMLLTRITTKAIGVQGAESIVEALRAVVTLLQDIDEVTPIVQSRTDTLEAFRTHTTMMKSTLSRLEKLCEADGKRYDGMGERVQGMVDTLQGLETAVKSVAGRTVEAFKAESTILRSRQNERAIDEGGPVSFAQAVASTPERHTDAVARVALVSRQVVVERMDGEGAESWLGLTEKEIVMKAQMAVDLLAKDGAAEAATVKFLHARKTARGGAILTTETEEAARWLRTEVVMDQFAGKLGGTLRARADLCMLIAEYVPVSFTPELFTAFTQVERENNLTKGSIREARYIKQVHRRKDNQRSAHMIFGFADVTQANQAIRKGLIIEGKHVNLRRHRVDPHRCLKCQQIGVAHRAAECKAIHDTCGRCAGAHKTDACQVEDQANFRCVNCKVTGHASVDRGCTFFLTKMREKHDRFPDYRYRFFPTQDPQTWEMDSYGRDPIGRNSRDGDRPDKALASKRGPSGWGARPQKPATGTWDQTRQQRDEGWQEVRRARGGEMPERSTAQGAAAWKQTTLDQTFSQNSQGWAGPNREPERRHDPSAWGSAPDREEVGEMSANPATGSTHV
jgi:hypothetical protein